jgi:two-component sensor histidine kinase
MIGQILTRENAGALFRAMAERQPTRSQREYAHQPIAGTFGSEGPPAPVVQEAYPIENSAGQIVGGMLIETNLLESERLKRRSEVFQRTLRALQQMALRGESEGVADLSPFGEYDGVLITDAERIIRYMSGIATNLYRNVGYGEPLVGKPLSYLETQDDELVRRAMERRACLQIELEERGRTWVKKVIPIMRPERASLFAPAREHLSGALLLIHDDTEARQRTRELMIKTTMIKEMHHRVKNDLQTVASLLRMQARRMQTAEAKGALAEAVNRILSIAVIHEFLSEQDTRVINIREVAQRIIQQMQQGVLDPAQRIALTLGGPSIYLPARQATSCALVVNELLQNALEHGYDAREAGGTISLTFQDHGDAVELIVHDDGRGLPQNFSLERVDSLGLKIVQMLVTQDLKGQIDLQSDHGVSAMVRFPKIPLGGEETWNEPE